MVRVFISLLVIVALVYLGLCAALFAFQRSLIYYPQASALGAHDNTVTLPVAGAALEVSVRPHDGANALIYFGGNAEDVSLSLHAFSQAFADHAIYMPHYRGYGGSSGSPSEQSIAQDAVALFDRVHAEHLNVVVVGRSLGSGVAVRLASRRPVSRLVLVTPYDSLQDLAAQQFSFFPVKWLLIDKFESWRYAPLVSAPTLVIAAEHDEVIPRESSDRLYGRFTKGVATFKLILGASHNTISDSPEYFRMLQNIPRKDIE
jgi:pimeloyl-ACP methyl ester carboxylesterase